MRVENCGQRSQRQLGRKSPVAFVLQPFLHFTHNAWAVRETAEALLACPMRGPVAPAAQDHVVGLDRGPLSAEGASVPVQRDEAGVTCRKVLMHEPVRRLGRQAAMALLVAGWGSRDVIPGVERVVHGLSD